MIDLIIKAETEGLDTEEEFIEYVQALVSTGLVNSTGSNQRFVANAVAEYGADFFGLEEA
jgi:hypothetical protein